MALPSGYTKLDYIESSGAQYINTGFKPNQNTRCVIDIENLSSAQAAFFGARASQTAASFTYFSLTATTGRSDYGSSKQSMSFTNTVGRYTVDQNKNVCTANGVTATGTANTFQLTHNLYLMAVNQADAAIQNAKVKLYSAKIYDNETLVRDFIPCKNASGAIGLWDNVNSVFYVNAGTGTFSAGTKHKTLIDGSGYEIKSGRVLIAGTGYDVKKGRTLIGGTGYDIKLGVPVGELAVGSSVYMNVNGVRTEFIVVHQGNPDSNWYTAGGNGTWVLLKQVSKQLKCVVPNNVNTSIQGAYQGSFLDTYANGEFLTSLDDNIQNIIQQVTLKHVCYGYSSHYQEEITCKIMIPDIYDLGLSINDTSSEYSSRVHNKLAYFENDDNNRRIATNGSSNSPYFTRDFARLYVSGGRALYCYYVTTDGLLSKTQSGTMYARPLYVLPPDAKIDSDFNIIEP